MTEKKIRFAYAHSMAFPNNEANAFDAVWTASALAERVETKFIIKSTNTSIKQLKNYYYIPETKLCFNSLHLNLVPDRVLMRIDDYYAKALSGFLRLKDITSSRKYQNVLYMRDPKLLRYFGQKRARQGWLNDWITIYESHDPLGLDPALESGEFAFNLRTGPQSPHQHTMLQAAQHVDQLICNTQALADDLRQWSGGRLNPAIITLASPLPRLDKPPIVTFGEKIVLGYIGTIDTFRGVDILVMALRHLPDNFSLRLVGKFRQELGVDPDWLQALLSEPGIGSKVDLVLTDHIADVGAEIDRCDILVQPASMDIIDAFYATPQKSFGYMVRGKPILVADVPCHHELFTNGVNALMYRLTPHDLAEKVLLLAANPQLAHTIACAAWKKSELFSYHRRSSNILDLINFSK